MPTPLKLKAPFLAESFYHIVCKSIDGILLFRDPQDYDVFRQRFLQFNSSFFQIWSYSLLPNHTHHVVKVNTVKAIRSYLEGDKKIQRTVAMNGFLQNPENEKLLDEMLERQMNSFLVSYVTYYNTRYNRKGGLFQKPFKRIEITDDAYLQQAIIYTNANAQKHKLVSDFANYPYCSYLDVMQDRDRWIALNDVIDFFGSKEKFEEIHKIQVDYYYKNSWPSSKLE